MLRFDGAAVAAAARCIVLLAVCLSPTTAAAAAIERRGDTSPAPFVFKPTQNWNGIDGLWNTFTLRVGTPPRYHFVVPVTSSQQNWIVDRLACNHTLYFGDNYDPACEQTHGGLFNVSESSTWVEQGWYNLWIDANLGYKGKGHYGFDTVSLGFDADNGPTVRNVTVGTTSTDDFWLGTFGLHPKNTNFSTFAEHTPSLMTYLKQQGHIPSLSYGYHAGAAYRYLKVLASLTLGGYDKRRAIQNNISFPFAPDNERELVVWLRNIRSKDTDLLSGSFNYFIDSSVPELWLPVTVCQQFEKVFNLTYDEGTQLYLVDNDLRGQLIAENTNITFTIANSENGGSTVDIVFPYKAFDQLATPPYRGISEKTSYFPLRRAANETQYVLGRTFLQEAYIVVDHERNNFTVAQVDWQESMPSEIVPILSVNHKPGMKKGAIIGIAVGVGGAAIIAIALGVFFWRRRRARLEKERQDKLNAEIAEAKKDASSEKSAEGTLQNPESTGTQVFPKAELPADSAPRAEMSAESESGTLIKIPDVMTPTSPDGTGTMQSDGTFTTVVEIVEIENNERQIFEMEGDMPLRSEADGRMLSEKETMIIREQRYNGTDPEPMNSPNTPTEPSEAGSSPISPTSADTLLLPQNRRRNPLTAADVAMVPGTASRLNTLRSTDRGWDGGMSMPVSPLTPRAPVTLEETILGSPLSPLPTEGSDGTRTIASVTNTNPDPERRRFSYELDE